MRIFTAIAAVFQLAIIVSCTAQGESAIRVNQVGYLPDDNKVAVYISQSSRKSAGFKVCNVDNGKAAFRGKATPSGKEKWALGSSATLDFSALKEEGRYYIICSGIKSPEFTISPHAYDGMADRLLVYMRQQRCGFNPYTGKACHQNDGYITGHPTKNGRHIDVTGGWHDAADYLQYQTTSATATYQMAFAYLQTADKSIYGDYFGATGLPGANGIPDIADEIKWGLDWLDKMNPAPGEMYVQIADDRDHCGFRLPSDDHANYGYGPGQGRTVYYLSGEPQQRKGHRGILSGFCGQTESQSAKCI